MSYGKYEYKCPQPGCTTTVRSDHRGDRLFSPCPSCQHQPLHRVFGFAYHPPMQEHMNAATNQPVSNARQFSDQLKRASEEATLYSGIEHQYEPVDINDGAALGVTNEGLDTTNKERWKKGLPEVWV